MTIPTRRTYTIRAKKDRPAKVNAMFNEVEHSLVERYELGQWATYLKCPDTPKLLVIDEDNFPERCPHCKKQIPKP